MRNSRTTIAPAIHHDKPEVSQSFEKDYDFYVRVVDLPIAQRNLETRNCASLPPKAIKSTILNHSREFSPKLSLKWNLQKWQGVESLKTTETYPLGICLDNWQYSKINKISNGMNTHVSKNSPSLIKNPLDEIFDNTSSEWRFTSHIAMISTPFCEGQSKNINHCTIQRIWHLLKWDQ